MYYIFKVALLLSGLVALLAVLLIVIDEGDDDIVTSKCFVNTVFSFVLCFTFEHQHLFYGTWSFADYADSMDLLKKISRNVLVNYTSKEEVAFETLWQERACVVTFLRRFGWSLCRLGAKELSDIKPVLDEHDVR